MLPKVKKDISHVFDEQCRPSEDVLVRIERFAGWHIGRYYHSIGEWSVNGFHGDFKVTEWAELPDSGHKI